MKAAVINASPLIILARAGYIDLLPRLFSSIAVPGAVVTEIRAGSAEAGFGSLLAGGGWLSVVDLGSLVSPLAGARLGRGETEVLEYASIHAGTIAVVDDKAARRMADGLGIPRIGTLGVLAAATRARYLSDFAKAAAKVPRRGFILTRLRWRKSRKVCEQAMPALIEVLRRRLTIAGGVIRSCSERQCGGSGKSIAGEPGNFIMCFLHAMRPETRDQRPETRDQ